MTRSKTVSRSIPVTNPSASSEDEDEERLDLPARIVSLRRMQTVDIIPSGDASVNYDSIVFLAKNSHSFAKILPNSFYTSETVD